MSGKKNKDKQVLRSFSIGQGESPHVLILGGIHGDEFEPMLAGMNLIKLLEKKIVKGRVTLVPVVNQSAYNQGTRCGADSLDLARIMPGKLNGGEVSQETAHALSILIKEADYLIDLHTGGSLFDILPLTGYMLHRDKIIMSMQQKMAIAFGMPVIWGTAPEKGRTLSIAADYYIPAIYVECGGGLAVNKKTISLYEKGCINVLRILGLIKTSGLPDSNYKFWLEDSTPGQGSLQSKLPSPEDGIFVPSVSIGKKVAKGATLGYIIDPIEQKRTKIISGEEGLVFMLRISSKVKKGDSLGGILPLTPSDKKVKVIYAK